MSGPNYQGLQGVQGHQGSQGIQGPQGHQASCLFYGDVYQPDQGPQGANFGSDVSLNVPYRLQRGGNMFPVSNDNVAESLESMKKDDLSQTLGLLTGFVIFCVIVSALIFCLWHKGLGHFNSSTTPTQAEKDETK